MLLTDYKTQGQYSEMQTCMNVELLSTSFSRKKKLHASYKKDGIKKVTRVCQSANMKKEEHFKFRYVCVCVCNGK